MKHDVIKTILELVEGEVAVFSTKRWDHKSS